MAAATARRIRTTRKQTEKDIRIGDDGSNSLSEIIRELEGFAGLASSPQAKEITQTYWTMETAISRQIVSKDVDSHLRSSWLGPYKAFGSINWRSNFTSCNSYSMFPGVKKDLLAEANRLRKQKADNREAAQSQRVAITSLQRVVRGRAGRRRADRRRAIEENRRPRPSIMHH